MSEDTYHRAWAGNWYRGSANWLENRLNNTLDKNEYHDDRVMMRDAMTKLNQAADEIDRLHSIDSLFNALKRRFDERAVDCLEWEKSYREQYIRAEKAQDERDALAAYVERLLEAATPKTIDLIRCGIGSNYSGHLYDKALAAYRDPLVQALEDTPATSLARRDLIKQAEGFESMADECRKRAATILKQDNHEAMISKRCAVAASHRAKKLRRQAEGDKQ